MIRVATVAPHSIAADLGLSPGTELLRVNDRELQDFLDWEFLTADEQFLLLARLPEGQTIEFDIERPEGRPLGVELEPPRIRRCGWPRRRRRRSRAWPRWDCPSSSGCAA